MSTKSSPVPFESLSPADKRRAIARDAIAQVKAKKLKARNGTFMKLQSWESVDETKTLRSLYKDTQEAKGYCEVCALGAVLASQLDLNGDCSLEDIVRAGSYVYPYDPCADENNAHGLSPFITQYFSPVQLVLIEIAFEWGRGAFDCWAKVEDALEFCDRTPFQDWLEKQGLVGQLTPEEAASAIRFGKSEPDDEKRLLKIMRSIEQHPEGLFDPLRA